MKLIKKASVVFAIITLGFVINTLITVYTAQIGNHAAQTEHGCRGVSYIISGFPMRDVYVVDYSGGECGVAYIHKGNTGIGKIPYLFNWTFWSSLVALTPSAVRKLRKNAHLRH